MTSTTVSETDGACRRQSAIPLLTIFAVGLLFRIPAALLTFGSVDVKNTLIVSDAIFQGNIGAGYNVPYFPMVTIFIWLGGIVERLTFFPPTFGYKIIPIIFDSAIAALVYYATLERGAKYAICAGLLYACSPLAILITSIHGQWDAIALFLVFGSLCVRDHASFTRRNGFTMGALFTMSILVKPIAVMLATILPPIFRGGLGRGLRDTRYIAGLVGLLGGAVVTVSVAALGFSAAGFHLAAIVDHVVAYGTFTRGTAIFGLPFAFPNLWLVHLLQYRFILIGASFVIAYIAYRFRASAMTACLLLYCLCLGTTGLCPQYLVWPLAPMLICGRVFQASVCTVVCTGFLVPYYLAPHATLPAWENMSTFSVIREFSYLGPSMILDGKALTSTILTFGNLAIPILFLAIFVSALRDLMRGKGMPSPSASLQPALHALRSWCRHLLLSCGLILLAVYLLVLFEWGTRDIPLRCAEHCLERYTMLDNTATKPVGGFFNIPVILLALAAANGILLARLGWSVARHEAEGGPE